MCDRQVEGLQAGRPYQLRVRAATRAALAPGASPQRRPPPRRLRLRRHHRHLATGLCHLCGRAGTCRRTTTGRPSTDTGASVYGVVKHPIGPAFACTASHLTVTRPGKVTVPLCMAGNAFPAELQLSAAQRPYVCTVHQCGNHLSENARASLRQAGGPRRPGG